MVTARELASEIGVAPKAVRAKLRRRFPNHVRGARWDLTEAQADQLVLEFMGSDEKNDSPRTQDRDESYVLDLCDGLLGERCRRQHRFSWLVGDAGKSGRRVRLPVDGFYERQGLVIEYRERQHSEAVPHFDKPGRLTVSGVDRGVQRKLYDARREAEIPAHGLRLVAIDVSDLCADGGGRLIRDVVADRAAITRILWPERDGPRSGQRNAGS